MNTSEHSPSVLVAGFHLDDAQRKQQADLALRLMHMAMIGTPRVEHQDPAMPTLLALHALATTFLALADANPGATATAASLACDMGIHLLEVVEQRATAAH